MVAAQMLADGLFAGDDGVPRCRWCMGSPAYQRYHDHEWGLPVTDERRLFEKICLEGFQAGLSWLTILNKRENFRAAFANFEADELSRFGAKDVERLLGDAGIVRHRGKIESTINNARRVLELREEFGSLVAYAWAHEADAASRPKVMTLAALRDELVSRGGAYGQSLARGKSVRVALNQVMSDESAVLVEGCEVAFFPPVTGG